MGDFAQLPVNPWTDAVFLSLWFQWATLPNSLSTINTNSRQMWSVSMGDFAQLPVNYSKLIISYELKCFNGRLCPTPCQPQAQNFPFNFNWLHANFWHDFWSEISSLWYVFCIIILSYKSIGYKIHFFIEAPFFATPENLVTLLILKDFLNIAFNNAFKDFWLIELIFYFTVLIFKQQHFTTVYFNIINNKHNLFLNFINHNITTAILIKLLKYQYFSFLG